MNLPITRECLRLAAATVLVLLASGSIPAQEPSAQREFTISARRFQFNPGRLDVRQDDLVKITLQSDDIAHSFTVDAYRIAKRVAGKQTVTFEFRADRAGSFPFYCSLDLEAGCKEMRGELVVSPR